MYLSASENPEPVGFEILIASKRISSISSRVCAKLFGVCLGMGEVDREPRIGRTGAASMTVAAQDGISAGAALQGDPAGWRDFIFLLGR